MKFIITLLMISYSSVAFSQMTFNEITNIYKMDMDQFEQYAISRGYEFYKFDRNENVNGVQYLKGVGKQTKYISLYDVFFDKNRNITFQTSVSSELLSIKTQMKKSGYTLYNSYFMDDNITKVDKYRNSKFEMSIFTIPPNENEHDVRYEIGFGKY